MSDNRLSRAIFTVVRHEPFFLPIWLKHHRKTFDHIYVLFHQSYLPEELAACQKWQAIPIVIHNPTSYCWAWITETANEFARFLFKSFKLVAYADVDEFIVDTDGSLDRPINNVLRCNGVSVLHHFRMEPRLDLSLPLSSQRKFYTDDSELSKPIVKTNPNSVWDMGFHFLKTHPDLPICKGLYLVHLHYVDYNLVVKRHIQRGQFDNISAYEYGGMYGSPNFLSQPEVIAELMRRWEPESKSVTQQLAAVLDRIELSDRIENR